MTEVQGRCTPHVRLIGQQTDQRWRRALLAEGIVLPASGRRHVAVVDVTGSPTASQDILAASAVAGTEPLVAVTGLNDPLPAGSLNGAEVLRLDRDRPKPLLRALKSAAHSRLMTDAAALRLRALSAFGQSYPAVRPEGQGGPAALLTDPSPTVLALIRQAGWKNLVAPLSSSQTLRLLESHHASALVIHLSSEQEHRIPVLKLIRRQSELNALPVAVITESWDDEKAANWFSAGADILARPSEIEAVMHRLQRASDRYVCDRTTRLSLHNSCMGDAGEPSAIIGERLFHRIAMEHQAQGDPLTIGAVELDHESQGTDTDLSEAGVYMAMALSPLDFICRPRPNLFLVGMPYADKFYAGRTMRTLQTLIEDLKFGHEPDGVLMQARTTFAESEGNNVPTMQAKLVAELLRRRTNLLQA